MRALLLGIRASHPLFRLRRFGPLARVLASVDRPIWGRVAGIRWRIRVRLVSHASFLLLGTTEPAVVREMKRVAESRRVSRFWDVGANFGFYTWLLKSADDALEVTMFEPEPTNLELIRATLDRNQVGGVRVVAAAASDARGEAVFVRDLQGASCGTLEHGGAGPSITVPTVRLDDLNEDVDLIKIDVEGHEEAVLRGALATIERCRPVVVMECFPENVGVVSHLEELGYVSTRIDGDNYLLEPR
jgi:FkbM family methyltransferase